MAWKRHTGVPKSAAGWRQRFFLLWYDIEGCRLGCPLALWRAMNADHTAGL